jgi:hypothetical protein
MLRRLLLSNAILLTGCLAASVASADEAPRPTVTVTPPSAPAADAKLIIEVDEPRAHVSLDDRPLDDDEARRPQVVAPGHHVVEARVEGRPPQRQEVEVGAGQTSGVVLRLVPLSTDAIGYDAPVEGPRDHAHGETYRLPLLLGGAALAAGGLGLGVAMNATANARADEAHLAQATITRAGGTSSACASPPSPLVSTCSALQHALSARDLDANLSVASYVTGGVLAAATVTYLIWPVLSPVFHHHDEHHSSWLASVRPTPSVAPNGAGLVLGGSF